jgi:hypothetical protein
MTVLEPSYDVDLYSNAAIADPYPYCRALATSAEPHGSAGTSFGRSRVVRRCASACAIERLPARLVPA